MFGRSWHLIALLGVVLVGVSLLVGREGESGILSDAVSQVEAGSLTQAERGQTARNTEESFSPNADFGEEEPLDFASWASEDDLDIQGPQSADTAQSAPTQSARGQQVARSSGRGGPNNIRYDPSGAEGNLARDVSNALRRSGSR